MQNGMQSFVIEFSFKPAKHQDVRIKPTETPSTADDWGGYFGVLFCYVAGVAEVLHVIGLGVEEEAAGVRHFL
ncbi:MAG: hypothetical protein M1830_005623 [Pleopsidium flavum]|nr:MAG: hypothetical protein M1830_009251 [Pleopsidium flavum]KAI9880090.1 MAG: hypothetical protein M1830_005623 [Pleopsidium flavum]